MSSMSIFMIYFLSSSNIKTASFSSLATPSVLERTSSILLSYQWCGKSKAAGYRTNFESFLLHWICPFNFVWSTDDVPLNCKGLELGVDLSSSVMDFLPGFSDDDGNSIFGDGNSTWRVALAPPLTTWCLRLSIWFTLSLLPLVQSTYLSSMCGSIVSVISHFGTLMCFGIIWLERVSNPLRLHLSPPSVINK